VALYKVKMAKIEQERLMELETSRARLVKIRQTEKERKKRLKDNYDKELNYLDTMTSTVQSKEEIIKQEQKVTEILSHIETDRVKSIIENTISTPAKPVEEIVEQIAKLDMTNIPNVNPVNTKESLTLLTKAFMAEGIELDPTPTTNSTRDLQHLHSLTELDILKIEIKYHRSPIDNSTGEELIKSPQKIEEFKNQMRMLLAEELGIPFETIVISNLRVGSLIFDVIVGAAFLAIQKFDVVLKAKDFMEYKNTILNILSNNFGPDHKPMEIKITSLAKPLKLRLIPGDFDSRGDLNFPSASGEKQMRGGIVYHQPTNKWVRRGLAVLGLYGKDDWIAMNDSPGEWAVGFHGTSSKPDAFTSIATTRFFGVGTAHACAGYISKALHTNGQKYGGKAEQAIYFTKDIEHCYKMTVDGYEIAFQCRINPKSFYDSDPDKPANYCIVRGSENIRPYGICFKKHSTLWYLF